MENSKSLPLIKEQLKITRLELQQLDNEKNRLVEKFSGLILNNQQEISDLRQSLRKKDKEIKKQEGLTWAARLAKHAGKDSMGDLLVKLGLGGDKSEEAYEQSADEVLKKKVSHLMERRQFLKEQIQQEIEAAQKIERDRTLLIKELKRLRGDKDKGTLLKEKIDGLEKQLKEARFSSINTSVLSESLIDDKDKLIKKYEKMLYGDYDSKGLLPSDIIEELKEELNTIKEEKSILILDLETLKEDHADMESKVILLEQIQEESGKEEDFRPNTESRATAAAEFSGGLESFLITYSDLVTLLLVIFVLLYTISHVDDQKFAEALSSFQEKEFRIEKHNVRLTGDELEMLKRVRTLVQDNVNPESLVRSDVQTIIVRLKSADLFDPGSGELVPGGAELILAGIEETIQEGVKQVFVDGHTDNVPINSEKYPSNWELSAVRASSVARVIIDRLQFPPERMVVTGYGQYRPWKPNTSDENRGLNRRVEIKILKDIKVAEQERRDAQNNPNPTNLIAVKQASP